MPQLHDLAEAIIALSALGALCVSIVNSRKITNLNISVDGRLSSIS